MVSGTQSVSLNIYLIIQQINLVFCLLFIDTFFGGNKMSFTQGCRRRTPKLSTIDIPEENITDESHPFQVQLVPLLDLSIFHVD